MVTMSQKELHRVKVIENAADGRLSVREASRLPHLSERQAQRLKRRCQPDSVDWVRHGNRGRSTPWAVSPPQKQLVLTLARGKYVGFNDSHLTEKLCAEEGLALSRETVRRILRAAKLASPQKRRPRQYRSRRPPRPRFGMMALTDASRHDWLQGWLAQIEVDNRAIWDILRTLAFTCVLVRSGVRSVILGGPKCPFAALIPAFVAAVSSSPWFSWFLRLRWDRAVTRPKCVARSRTQPTLW